MESAKPEITYLSFVRVQIPTTPEFLEKWHIWIQGKVAKHYKRDKERIPDTSQRVRLRLLSKDFIARWFFKHLTDDLVDLPEMIRMTGNQHANHNNKIYPIYGSRSDKNSLWRVADILNLVNFDYERYFYSVQNHTIETDKFLRLLGYFRKDESGKISIDIEDYGILESLYRQGRIKPSELTDHDCQFKGVSKSSDGVCTVSGCTAKHFSRGFCKLHYSQSRKNSCPECDKGRALLNQKGVSLARRWSDPAVAKVVAKLRWNDSQLIPFLRNWQKGNALKSMPRYIMRHPKEATIDAGLLRYANMVIDNDVFNHFKSMIRSDDIAQVTLDVKSDPDQVSSDKMYWEVSEIDSSKTPVFIDTGSYEAFQDSEYRFDIRSLMSRASLSDVEIDIISKVDLEESSIAEVSSILGISSSKINRIRSSALDKMRRSSL